MKIQNIGTAALVSATLLLVGCGGEKETAATPDASKVESSAPTGDRMAIAKGTVKFGKTCATCHGADAKGMLNLGSDLTISEFFRDSSNEELLAYVKVGRPADGTTAAMPPKGGFPDLTDEDIMNIIKYLRTIQQ